MRQCVGFLSTNEVVRYVFQDLPSQELSTDMLAGGVEAFCLLNVYLTKIRLDRALEYGQPEAHERRTRPNGELAVNLPCYKMLFRLPC